MLKVDENDRIWYYNFKIVEIDTISDFFQLKRLDSSIFDPFFWKLL